MIYDDELLLSVEKPARYVGGEVNAAFKDPAGKTRFCFCFPDSYEVGMSCLATQIIYSLVNNMEGAVCERAFAPWPDMEAKLREKNLPLSSVDSNSPLAEFDFLGFSLQYEMCYTNVINMLDLGGIPLYAKDRGSGEPIVCLGGPCAFNPEPLAEIADFVYIGDAENGLAEIIEERSRQKAGGAFDKIKFLEAIAAMPGVYVPSFYNVAYSESGCIESFTPNNANAPAKVKKSAVHDLDAAPYPTAPLVPLIETVQCRAAIELFRGCPRGCRFCAAGFVGRPVRARSVPVLLSHAKSGVESTGFEELSLVSLSTGDYPDLGELCDKLFDMFEGENIRLSLPSLRIDAFALETTGKAAGGRKQGLTFAPEAGTQRLRDVLNKNLTEEEILNGARLAFEGGWNRVKLYFMAGLPTETDEDILAIAKLGEAILDEFYRLPKSARPRPAAITISCACFVPKPFTPFQWEAQNDMGEFLRKHKLVKSNITKKQIAYNYHDTKLSVIEGVLARGDRRALPAVLEAWRLGARFDGWSEKFDYNIWEAAFSNSNVSAAFYASRERAEDEILPWDFIDIGVTKEFLLTERRKSREGATTADCRRSCAGCGLKCGAANG